MKKAFVLFSLMAISVAIQAHDFAVPSGTHTLYYSVTDVSKSEVCVTFQGNAVNASAVKPYTGMVQIPQTVKYNGKTYSVTSISDKAFCNADKMTGITMSSGIKSIGLYAFDGCVSLENIIFPGNPVEIGEGAFFRCPSICRITFGSDWTGINLKWFRWSNSLTEIFVPAKIRQIQNMKSLVHLESISVDANNPYYSSDQGMLYSIDGKTLYGAPRAIKDQIQIKEGTERIYPGALADCYQIKGMVFPSTLISMSYTELSELRELNSISFNSSTPISTASFEGEQVFALKLAPQVSISVPKKALKNYKSAIVSEAGEYAELEANVPANGNAAVITVPKIVREGELAKAENLNGDKGLGK